MGILIGFSFILLIELLVLACLLPFVFAWMCTFLLPVYVMLILTDSWIGTKITSMIGKMGNNLLNKLWDLNRIVVQFK